MTIEWRNKYVDDGQIEPDKFNRWLRVGYVKVSKAALSGLYPEQMLEDFFKDEIPVAIACIHQKGTLPGSVPSLIDKFCACIPQVKECLNGGLSLQVNVFGNTIEEVEKQVEKHYSDIETFFKNIIQQPVNT
jgi:hypothetical protein